MSRYGLFDTLLKNYDKSKKYKTKQRKDTKKKINIVT